VSRLLVVLAPEEASLELLALYARLAARLRREMVGLLLDDPAFTGAAALPFGRLLSARGGAEASLDPATGRRALRIFGDRLRRRLAEVCAQQRIQGSIALAFELAAGDILAFGPGGPGDAPAGTACPMLLTRARGRCVAVLYEGSDDILDLGAAIAHDLALPLRVLALGPTAAAARSFARRAADWQAPATWPAEIMAVSDAEPLALERAIAAAAPRAVAFDACNAATRWPRVAAALGRLGPGATAPA
jgi:hypothetical protein